MHKHRKHTTELPETIQKEVGKTFSAVKLIDSSSDTLDFIHEVELNGKQYVVGGTIDYIKPTNEDNRKD